MKTSKPLPHRLLALLLALCLTLSLLPTTIGAASVTVTTEQQLKDAYAAIPRNGSGTIVISGTVDLSQRLVLARPVSVTISGGTLRAAGDLWQPFGEKNGPNWCMVHLVDGSLTLQSTTLNANHLTSVLTISGDTLGLTMTDTKIQNGQLDMAGNGPGLILRNTVGGSKTATITNCTFTGNTGTLNSQSSGGAMYVGEGWNVTIGGGTTFSGNTAHSGGAIYCYQGAVNCDNTVRFLNNTAGQRGGAIHSHGDVVVRGSTFSGNSSGQFGGTFYVSANEDSGVQRIGRLVLEDVQITGSSAGNSGGAAYIASMAELYIKGNTSLKGNTVTDGSYESNIMVSSSTGRLIVYGPITGADKSIGVSTANPKTGLELVYSVETARTIAGYNIPLYKMSGTAANYQKFFYDSEVWTLLKSTANADRMSLQTAVAGASQIIFDYNLPGMTTKIHTGLTPGATVTPPSVSTQSESGVTYAFQGWYDAPKGGTKLTGVATAVAGTSVYYAQWKVTTSSTGGGASGTGDMYLIYFDQNYDGGGLAAAQVAAGTFTITVEDDMGNEESFTVSIPFGFPENPFRPGYAFLGWAESPTSTTPVSSSWRPGKTDTLFGIWKADSHTLTWNANGGSGGQITSQDFGTIIEAPPAAPTRNGYTFSGWYQDAGCGILLTAASKVYKDQTFWAKWTPKEYTITWNADYTGGAIATTKQNYDEPLSVMTDPVRDGFFFAGWHTGQGGAGTRAEAYGKVDGNIQFYACWTQRVMDYTVTIDWQDQSDNDALRPEKVTVELLRNGITMGLTYDMSAADSIEGGDKWRRTFQNLAATDNVSSEIAYSVAIASSIPGAYTYKGDFTAQNAGYILMSHDLITVDVDAYVVWDDDQDRDGLRPNKVQLQLLADGQPIPDNTYTTVVLPAGTGDTWGHVFTDMQRYLRTDTGRVEIAYTIVVSEADAGALSHYDVSYSGRAATLEHDIQTVSKQAVVEWNDNNNQDNKRPASMSVQLYADGEPVAGKFVTLSDANGWAYEWTDLPKLVSGGREIVYSAQVTSMLTEYTAASTQMTIEMTYVPLSTTIPVFLTWVDDQDVDGLRPEIVEAELYADGVPTGAIQKLSAANNWSMTWTGYPIHSGGIRIEYTVELTALPNGYEAEYIGIYDQTGLSITLTHDRIRATQTAAVVWDDQDNLAGARMSRVDVMLYADSEPLHKLTATLTEADGWSFDFVDMPVYQGGGQEIQYGIQLISAKGNYTATYEGMTLTLHYAAETMDVPLTILWSDGDNASGTRPLAVAVHLTT